MTVIGCLKVKGLKAAALIRLVIEELVLSSAVFKTLIQPLPHQVMKIPLGGSCMFTM